MIKLSITRVVSSFQPLRGFDIKTPLDVATAGPRCTERSCKRQAPYRVNNEHEVARKKGIRPSKSYPRHPDTRIPGTITTCRLKAEPRGDFLIHALTPKHQVKWDWELDPVLCMRCFITLWPTLWSLKRADNRMSMVKHEFMRPVYRSGKSSKAGNRNFAWHTRACVLCVARKFSSCARMCTHL